jgi:ketosteroid isomerase-like protein
VLRSDGMTRIKSGAVAFYSCVSAEQQGILVTAGYVLTGGAVGTVAAASRAPRPAEVPASPVHAAPPDVPVPSAADQEIELVALTNAWIDAVRARNLPALETLVAPGFVLQDWDGSGRLTRPEWLMKYVAGYDYAEYHHSAIVARIYGSVGTVTSKWYWRGVSHQELIEAHGYAADVWQRNAGRWQVVSRTTVTLPGKE